VVLGLLLTVLVFVAGNWFASAADTILGVSELVRAGTPAGDDAPWPLIPGSPSKRGWYVCRDRHANLHVGCIRSGLTFPHFSALAITVEPERALRICVFCLQFAHRLYGAPTASKIYTLFLALV
jgi:hypothetical protein